MPDGNAAQVCDPVLAAPSLSSLPAARETFARVLDDMRGLGARLARLIGEKNDAWMSLAVLAESLGDDPMTCTVRDTLVQRAGSYKEIEDLEVVLIDALRGDPGAIERLR